MARYNVTQGVFLTQGSGGTPQSPVATNISTTSVLNFRETTGNGTVKRVKPVDLITSMTSYYAEKIREDRSIVSLDNGNWAPITNYIATSANKTAVNSSVVAATSKAAGKVRIAVKDMQWNAAQSVAEFGKTLSFVLSSSKHLMDCYRAARRGDVLGLSELFQHYNRDGTRRPPSYRRVANIWLQWRYAVRPAIMDLSDAMKELSRSGMTPIIQMAQGSATENVGQTIFQGNIDAKPAFRRRDGTVRVKYVFYFKATNFRSLTSLGLTNLPALLWELTPYSFVVDNFLPIGTYLSGLDAGYGINVHSGCVVEWHKWSEYATFRGGRSSSAIDTYSRAPNPSIPNQPLPSWQTPGGDVPSKCLDALSLLSQVVRGRR